MRNEREETALHESCRAGNCELVKILLNAVTIISENPEHKDDLKNFICMGNEHKETALHLASMVEDRELIRILLNVAAGNSEYRKGDVDVLKEFIFMRNERGETALHVSCSAGNCEIVEILLNAVTIISENPEHKDDLKNFIFICNEHKQTALHRACEQCDKKQYFVQVARLLLDAAAGIRGGTGHKDVLKKFLFMGDEHGDTALHLACEALNVALVIKLMNYAAEISEDTPQEFIFYLNGSGSTAVEKVLFETARVTLFQILFKRMNNKLDFIVNYGKKDHFAFLALISKKQELLTVVLEEIKHDEMSFKQFVLTHGTDSALYNCICSVHDDLSSSIVVECLLSTAKSINDNNETLKKFLLPHEILYRPLNEAIKKEKLFVVKIILSFAEDIDDGNYTLKKLLYNTTTQESTLVTSTEDLKCNTLHIACLNGNAEIIKVLISYSININDGGKTLRELVTSTKMNNFTPFQLLRNGYTDEIKQVIESLISVAKINNNKDVVNVLEEINMKYTVLHSSL